MRKFLLLKMLPLFLVLLTSIAWAQERTVTGKVTSSEDGSTLPGVNVVIKGTTTGTVTDSNGSYAIVVSNGTQILVFSFIGLTTSEAEVGSRSVVDVSLSTDIKQLSEIVVVGYGTQDKRSITGSISAIGAKQFENLPLVGVDQALQGRAAGVQVSSNSGTPGGGISVRVRGPGSISASNEPLYVINGIPVNTGNYSQLGAGNQQTNALSDINPNDIESIEVLKDASASAIYGSRATNGVVLITTKRGKEGKPKLTFDYYTGIQETWKRITPVSGSEMVSLLQEQVVNRYGVRDVNGNLTTPAFTGNTPWASDADFGYYFWGANSNAQANGSGQLVGVESPVDKAKNIRSLTNFKDPSTAFNTNWQDEIFRQGVVQNYQLGVSGGTERTTYNANGGYYKETGIIKGFSFDRLNFSFTGDHKITDKFKIGTSTQLSRSVNNRRNNDNNIFGVLSAATLLASDIPVYNSDGSYGRDGSSSVDNPVALANETKFVSTAVRVLGQMFGEYEIMKGFTATSRWSIDYRTQKDDRFIPTTLNQGAGLGGQGTTAYSQDLNWISSNYLNYRKTIANDHNISATAGFDYQQSTYESIFAQATGFPGNDVVTLSAGSVFTSASSDATSWGLASYYGRANYDYQGKYLFGASLRTDGSSRFSPNFRYGTFYSISGGWRISDEKFMNGLSNVLSDAKLRVGYGTTGNSNFGNFNYLTLYGTGYNYNSQGGYAPTQIGNSGLKWESGNQFTVGIDFTLLNRFTINVDLYDKQTTDLLLAVNVPNSTGFNSQTKNAATMDNKGIDINITSTNIKNTNFSWTTNWNISAYQNKIEKLGVPAFNQGFGSRIQEGEALGAFYGYASNGTIKTIEELNALNTAAVASGNGTYYINANTRVGDLKFQDVDGNGVINPLDQKIIGNPNPKFFGGLTNNLSYKGIDLMVFLQYSVGNDMLNYTRQFATGMNSVFGQFAYDVSNRWTPANTNTDVPRAVFGDPSNNRRTSTRYIEDGSYMRIKNVVLGYTLPQSLINKLHISKLRVYVSAQNLFTFTDYKGFDPEVSTFSGTSTQANAAFGTDFLTYPQYRTYSVGLNLGF